jgi:iron complex transport system ATP-binding protein
VTAPHIEVRSLSLRVGETALLDDLSFSVADGTSLAVIGPNGAGKTTLLRCLLRIHTRWTGHIRILGRDLRDFRQRQLARRLAYVPQLEGRHFPFTVREFVSMSRYPHRDAFGGSTAGDKKAIDRALTLADVESMADARIEILSGGERQEVLIAAALAQEARILLLDEPTAFLDYRHSVRIHEILSTIRAETGTTTILVTHDLNEALVVANEVLALRSGRRVYHGPVSGLLDPAVPAEIFGVGFEVIDRGGGAPAILVPGEPSR